MEVLAMCREATAAEAETAVWEAAGATGTYNLLDVAGSSEEWSGDWSGRVSMLSLILTLIHTEAIIRLHLQGKLLSTLVPQHINLLLLMDLQTTLYLQHGLHP